MTSSFTSRPSYTFFRHSPLPNPLPGPVHLLCPIGNGFFQPAISLLTFDVCGMEPRVLYSSLRRTNRVGKYWWWGSHAGNLAEKKWHLSLIEKRLLVLNFLKACVLTFNLISRNLLALVSALNFSRHLKGRCSALLRSNPKKIREY